VTDAAAVLGALGAVGILSARSRAVLIGGFAALALAELLLARHFSPSGFHKLTTPAGVVAVVFGLAALAVLAAAFVRFAAAVPAVLVPLVPFRLPFDFGANHRFFVGLGQHGSLGRLIPLYVALAAAAAALAWRCLRGEEVRPLPPLVAVPAMLIVALMSLSLLWAFDLHAAANRLGFFVLPFAVLLCVVARSPFASWLPRVLAIEAVALGCLYAAVGIAEEHAHRLLFYEPKVAVANSYTSFFRVTSLFSDPSIYARHLVVSLTVLVVVVLLGRASLALCAVLMAFIWTGLYFSYSQSSMVALAASTVVVTVIAGGRRTRLGLAVAAAVLLVGGAVGFLALSRDHSPNRVLSGRLTLVHDTWVVVRNHPFAGVGVASQPAASRQETTRRGSARRVTSHTAPLTIAAELGIVGFALYLAFLAGAARLFWLLRRIDDALGLALLGTLTALVVHSLSYGVFFEDPLLWMTLAVGAGATVVGHVRVAEPSPVAARQREASAPAAR
jgi:O-antigen ligase/polysaccharide polymerase Wzy-like membrane protein